VAHAINAYRSEMDFIQEWLDVRTIADPQSSVPRSDAYADYKCWSQLEHTPTLGNRRLVEELHRRGYPTVKSNGVRRLSGVRLLLGASALRVIGGTAAKP
jgi:hypothetical protein